MKKYGFTLIELLAVIIIITIISLIATPLILNVIDKSKRDVFRNTAYGIKKAAEYAFLDMQTNGVSNDVIITYSNGVESANIDGVVLNYKGNKPSDGVVKIYSTGYISFAVHDGVYCATKGYLESEVNVEAKEYNDCVIPNFNDYSGASYPKISSGMIPIKWDENQWVKADLTDQWYNYDKKMWANVVLVTDEKREMYKNAQPGTVIVEEDVLAYLVWIPRYRYQLFNVDTEIIEEKTIEIIFESTDEIKSNGSTNGSWLTHPAFTFGSRELSGFWVGKFETSTDQNSLCYIEPSVDNCNNSDQMPRIKPTVRSLIFQNNSNKFFTSRKFSETNYYGLSSINDSHMIKNTEWGAVAFLSHSKYGINSEIWKNPTTYYITGCAGDEKIPEPTDDCMYTYNTSNGQKTSTTGNIYGIYDMHGGAWDRVMGVLVNNGIPYSGRNIDLNSGFNGYYTNGTLKTDGIDFPDPWYYDTYPYGTSTLDYTRRILGDATGEVNGWYNSYMRFVVANSPWFPRGGKSTTTDVTSIFTFSVHTGGTSEDSDNSFRVVILED